MRPAKLGRVGRLARSQGGLGRREYRDKSFGYRKPREYEFPDYISQQLEKWAENAALQRFVDSTRIHGHRSARIDPLDLTHREEVAALDPHRYGLGLSQKGMNEKYNVDGIVWTKRVGERVGEELWTLEDIVKRLRGVYVGNIGYEFMHSPSKTERLWFSHLLKSQSLPSPEDGPLSVMDESRKKRIHELLARSEVFDNFLQAKFPNLKRYGLEGGESMLPALDSLFGSDALRGVRRAILAMPHRGRLNLLTNLLKYPPSSLFHKIKGGSELPEDLGADGDVLSHLLSSPTLSYGSDTNIKVSLQANPSHLEAFNPVA